MRDHRSMLVALTDRTKPPYRCCGASTDKLGAYRVARYRCKVCGRLWDALGRERHHRTGMLLDA